MNNNQDIHQLHQQLNPENQPLLQDDGTMLAMDNLHGYHSAHVARAIRNTRIISRAQKDKCHGKGK